MKFWYRKSGGGNPESLEVWLSNTSNNINNFTTFLWKIRFTTTTYTQKVIPLDSFDGQEIYIAFANKGLYGFRINLDDIIGPEMSEICDVGVDSILSPINSFIMRPVGAGFHSQAIIKNYSNATQRNIPVICSIVGQSSILRYENIKYIDSLLVDSSKIISFDLFIPTIAELCTVKIRTHLTGDENTLNDQKTRLTLMLTAISEQTQDTKIINTSLNTIKPNPIHNTNTQIAFSISQNTQAILRIYGVAGCVVKTLVNENLNSGTYKYVWDTKDEQNKIVPEGIYFCSLQTSEQSYTKKIILTR